ncbi:hypothetical protein BDY21DRAFT_130965 [Lineolata rhizophorae]|uniref:Uncharacterized protein n=1 Tax=Lineolata rhizophorae TaxID=578093 RepID=A0A6A6PA45_9PEZI|nr:hypothetical protein BDY21DRAFT_130965 [Lineolata rhizophorae]
MTMTMVVAVSGRRAARCLAPSECADKVAGWAHLGDPNWGWIGRRWRCWTGVHAWYGSFRQFPSYLALWFPVGLERRGFVFCGVRAAAGAVAPTCNTGCLPLGFLGPFIFFCSTGAVDAPFHRSLWALRDPNLFCGSKTGPLWTPHPLHLTHGARPPLATTPRIHPCRVRLDYPLSLHPTNPKSTLPSFLPSHFSCPSIANTASS